MDINCNQFEEGFAIPQSTATVFNTVLCAR